MKKHIQEYGPETPGYAQLNEAMRKTQQAKAAGPRTRKKKVKEAAAAIAAATAVFFLVVLFPGCATSREGLDREARIQATIQKGLDFTQANVLPLVPSPWKEAFALACVGGGAALTAWNHNQGTRIKRLENGTVKAAVIVPPLPRDQTVV